MAMELKVVNTFLQVQGERQELLRSDSAPALPENWAREMPEQNARTSSQARVRSTTPDPWEWEALASEPAPTSDASEVLAEPSLQTWGYRQVWWQVGRAKLSSNSERVTSPEFQLAVGEGLCDFKLVVSAKPTRGKHGHGFLKAMGRGQVELKCQSASPRNQNVLLCLTVGTKRSATLHNFARKTCCLLADGWTLLDGDGQICLELAPQP
ncbi:unnamed protein product [Effrenium voratum]|nr:unnamed protein product [Effrenium voratum]